MSHPNQLNFIKNIASGITNKFNKLKILEIGALEVNGSIRKFFEEKNYYFGLDLISGKGVDVVASGHDYGTTGEYDITIACEMLEHNPFWIETIYNMIRVTKPGGLVILTCASKGRIEHGTSRTDPNQSPGTNAIRWNYYKNISVKELKETIKLDQHFTLSKVKYISTSCDLYFIGEKKETPTQQSNSILRNWLSLKGAELFDQVTENILKTSNPGIFRKALYFPVWLSARLFPEQYFQNFAIHYFRFAHGLSQKVLKIIRL